MTITVELTEKEQATLAMGLQKWLEELDWYSDYELREYYPELDALYNTPRAVERLSRKILGQEEDRGEGHD